eukprot:scaffold1640_cov161-Amphora_coffeaeformis.AAC.36
MVIRSKMRKSGTPMSSIFKRIGRKEREEEAVLEETSSKREDPKLIHVVDGVELSFAPNFPTQATTESRSPGDTDTRDNAVKSRSGNATLESRTALPFERISRRGPSNRQQQTRRTRSPSPWRIRRNPSQDNSSPKYLPASLVQGRLAKKKAERKGKLKKGLKDVASESNTNDDRSAWGESKSPRKATIQPVSRELNAPSDIEKQERQSQGLFADAGILGGEGTGASFEESLHRHKIPVGEESTGLKIVVYDNIVKSERRVRVTFLDTGETLRIKGEKIEPFLQAIFREALKKNQNIHIENGNIEDYPGLKGSNSQITTAVSFVNAIESKDSGRVGIPCDSGSQQNSTSALDGGSLSPVYFKRVCSLNKDDGIIAQEVESIGSKRKNSNEKQGPTMESQPSRPNVDDIYDSSGDGEYNADSIQNIIEALAKVKSAMGGAQGRSNTVCAGGKNKTSVVAPQVNQSSERSPLPPSIESIVEKEDGSLKSENRALDSSDVAAPRTIQASERPPFPSPTKSIVENEDGSLGSGNRGTDSFSVSADSFVKFALQTSQMIVEHISLSGVSSPLFEKQTMSALDANLEYSTEETRIALNERDTVVAEGETVEISRISTGQLLSKKCYDQYPEIERQASSNIFYPITAIETCQSTSEKPLGTSGHTVSPTSPCKEEIIKSEVHLEETNHEKQIPDQEALSPISLVHSQASLHGNGIESTTSGTLLDERGRPLQQQLVGHREEVLGESLQQVADDDVHPVASHHVNQKLTSSNEGEEVVAEDFMLMYNQVAVSFTSQKREESLSSSNRSSAEKTKSVIEVTTPLSSPYERRNSTQSRPVAIVQTVSESSESVSTSKTPEENPPYSRSRARISNQKTDIMHPPPSEVVRRARDSFMNAFLLGENKGVELKVLPLEQAKTAVQATVQIILENALDAKYSDHNEEASNRNFQSIESDGNATSVDSNGDASGTSSFLGSSDIPDDDSYWETSTVGYDDSTLETSTIQDMISWAQSQRSGRDAQAWDVVFSFTESLKNIGSVAITSDDGDYEVELTDVDQETDRDFDHTRSYNTVRSARSAASEENGYDQFAQHSTPLMEAFVFYVESTLEKMKGGRKRKKQSAVRMKARIDDNLSKFSEGLVHSFARIMRKNETKPNYRGRGGGGVATAEPNTCHTRKVKVETMDDWNDLVEAPTDDMMRAAFGLITTTISEEMTDFVPSRVMKTGKKQ